MLSTIKGLGAMPIIIVCSLVHPFLGMAAGVSIALLITINGVPDEFPMDEPPCY